MSGVGGVVAGVVGLSLLELVLSNAKANGHVNDVFTIAKDALDYWLDPTIPLIPDLAPPASTTHIEAQGQDIPQSYVQPAPSTLKHTIGPGSTVNV